MQHKRAADLCFSLSLPNSYNNLKSKKPNKKHNSSKILNLASSNLPATVFDTASLIASLKLGSDSVGEFLRAWSTTANHGLISTSDSLGNKRHEDWLFSEAGTSSKIVVRCLFEVLRCADLTTNDVLLVEESSFFEISIVIWFWAVRLKTQYLRFLP